MLHDLNLSTAFLYRFFMRVLAKIFGLLSESLTEISFLILARLYSARWKILTQAKFFVNDATCSKEISLSTQPKYQISFKFMPSLFWLIFQYSKSLIRPYQFHAHCASLEQYSSNIDTAIFPACPVQPTKLSSRLYFHLIKLILLNYPKIDYIFIPRYPNNESSADDRLYFDLGYIRIAKSPMSPDPKENSLIYARSDLITKIEDIALPFYNTGERVVAMSHLGKHGRFGNQIIQWLFLRLYSIRCNANYETANWIGWEIFSDKPNPIRQERQFYDEHPPSLDGYFDNPKFNRLWEEQFELINHDFFGYFDLHVKMLRHKNLCQVLLRPKEYIEKQIDDWLSLNVKPDEELIAIHIRRGDYVGLEEKTGYPFFRVIPISWYTDLLKTEWPKLKNPKLFIASDDPKISESFSLYAPITVDPSSWDLPINGKFLADYYILSRANLIVLANSTFSLTASMLASESSKIFAPCLKENALIPYDPWTGKFNKFVAL